MKGKEINKNNSFKGEFTEEEKEQAIEYLKILAGDKTQEEQTASTQERSIDADESSKEPEEELITPLFSEEAAETIDSFSGDATCETNDFIKGPNSVNIARKEFKKSSPNNCKLISTEIQIVLEFVQDGNEGNAQGAMAEVIAKEYLKECSLGSSKILETDSIVNAEVVGKLDAVAQGLPKCDDLYLKTENGDQYVCEVKSTINEKGLTDDKILETQQQLEITLDQNPNLEGVVFFNIKSRKMIRQIQPEYIQWLLTKISLIA